MIVHGDLQHDHEGGAFAQALAGGCHQQRTQALAAGLGMHVQGDDVAVLLLLQVIGEESGDVSANLGVGLALSGFVALGLGGDFQGKVIRGGDLERGLGRKLGDDGEAAALLDEAGELRTAVGDAGLKAQAVELEDGVEVLLLVVAQQKWGGIFTHGV